MEVPHTRLEDAKVVDNNGGLEVGDVGYVGDVGEVDGAGRGGDGEAVDNGSTGLPPHMGSEEVGI